MNVTADKTYTADDLNGTGPVACLDAALEQSDRYMQAEDDACLREQVARDQQDTQLKDVLR